jgi:hypothetical protein
LGWGKISEQTVNNAGTPFIERQAADYLTCWSDNAAFGRLRKNGRPGENRAGRSKFTFSFRQNQ